MNDKLSEQQTDAILKALDDAIEQGPWDESNFLRVIGKNLQDIRDKFSEQVKVPEQDKVKLASQLANQIALRSGLQEVFVALYSSEGVSLQSWERILMNLPKQMISRPIYTNEQDIVDLIKSKANKINEAYVSMYISQNDILQLSEDKTPKDKLGKPLLTLKDKSLTHENINQFVHQSGTYHYTRGRLVKKSLAEEV